MEGYEYTEKIYAEILSIRNAKTALYKQYFDDIKWWISDYTMVGIKMFEVTAISYDPAIVMKTDAKTSISFKSPIDTNPIRYLIIDFPADIWGSMLKKSDELSMIIKLITMDDDVDQPGEGNVEIENFYFRSTMLVIPLKQDMLSKRSHKLEITGLPMPFKQVKQLKQNIVLMGATKYENKDDDNSRIVPQYVALSHPDLYDFPVTQIVVPAGKIMLTITQDGGEASVLLIKKGVYSTKACFTTEAPVTKPMTAILNTQDKFVIKGEKSDAITIPVGEKEVCFYIGAKMDAPVNLYILTFKCDDSTFLLPPIEAKIIDTPIYMNFETEYWCLKGGSSHPMVFDVTDVMPFDTVKITLVYQGDDALKSQVTPSPAYINLGKGKATGSFTFACKATATPTSFKLKIEQKGAESKIFHGKGGNSL